MGNQQNKPLGIEVKSRFTKEELHMLEKIYQDLSARSLNSITKEVFLQFFPITSLWGERLFEFFDGSNSGKLTFEDFVVGLMACCKTSREARIKLLFSLYDLNHDGYIEKNEVLAMLYNYPKDQIRDILDEVAPDKGTKLSHITEHQRKAAVESHESQPVPQKEEPRKEEPIKEEPIREEPIRVRQVIESQQIERSHDVQSYDKTLEQFGLAQSEVKVTVKVTQERRQEKVIYTENGPERVVESQTVNYYQNEYTGDDENGQRYVDLARKVNDSQKRAAGDALMPGLDNYELTLKTLEFFGQEPPQNVLPTQELQAPQTHQTEAHEERRVTENFEERKVTEHDSHQVYQQSHETMETEQKSTYLPTTEPNQVTERHEEEHKHAGAGKLYAKDQRMTQSTTLNSRVKRYNSLMFQSLGEDRTMLSFDEFKDWLEKHPVLLKIFDDAFYQKIWCVEKSQEMPLPESSLGATEKLAEGTVSQLLIDQKNAAEKEKNKDKDSSSSDSDSDDEKKKKRESVNLENILEEKKEEVQESRNLEKHTESPEKSEKERRDSTKDKKTPVKETKEEKEKREKEEKERKEREKKEKKEREEREKQEKKEREEREKQEKKERKEKEEREKKERKEKEKLEDKERKERKEKEKKEKKKKELEELKGYKLRYHSQKPVIAGELFKQGKRTKIWKQRLYEVRDDFLFFYKKDLNQIPKRVIFLEGCYVEPLNDFESTHKYGFKIGYNSESYSEKHIYCNTKAELDEWIKVLKDQSNFPIHGRYVFKEKLGAGRYSFVYRAVSKTEPETEQAIKVVNKKALELGQREQILVEVSLIKSLSHPNIIKVHEVVETRRYLYIITDISKGGDLFSYILHKGLRLEEDAAPIMKQLLEAFDYLHDAGFVHRDIKPENVLLTLDDDQQFKQLKVIDFASAKFVTGDQLLHGVCGSANYTAPEVLLGQGYDKKIDSWSLGVIMYFMLRGLLPFDGQDVDSVLRNTLNKEVDLNTEFWEDVSLEGKDLLQRLLEKDPKKRISVKKALEHSWFDLDTLNFNKAAAMKREEVSEYYEDVYLIEDTTPKRATDSPAKF